MDSIKIRKIENRPISLNTLNTVVYTLMQDVHGKNGGEDLVYVYHGVEQNWNKKNESLRRPHLSTEEEKKEEIFENTKRNNAGLFSRIHDKSFPL